MYAYTLIYRSPFVTALLDRLYYILTELKSRLKSNGSAVPISEDINGPYLETIYAPHGSCVMFRRTFFEQGGRMNFKGFMYGEEIYIGEEARRRNLKIAWAPGLKVLHYKKVTTGKVLQAERVRWRLEISKILWNDYFSKRQDNK
jgi:GT2 family glycosyltransferase